MLSLTAITTLFAWAAPFLAAVGGPLGLALAWFGHTRQSLSSWRGIAIAVGIALCLVTVVFATIWIERLRGDRAAFAVMREEYQSIRAELGCPALGEPNLKACLAAIEAAKRRAERDEIARQRLQAAAEQARRDLENRRALDALEAERRAAARDAIHGDGPVPPVLYNSFARERAERGLPP